MDRALYRQQEIERRKEEAARLYPSSWAKLIANWSRPEGEVRSGCSVGLMYSASYLLRCGDFCWAIDPIRLKRRLPDAPEMDFAADLRPLSLVLLTHRHSDHLDFDLLRLLKDASITWVVPEALHALVCERSGLQKEQILTPRHLEPFEIAGLRILPFDSWHWEDPSGPGGVRGVPETGYLIEFQGKRWLFPCDIRTYDASLLPQFGPVDVLFAHLWLGRRGALKDPPTLLEAFCRFCLDLQPRQVVVTHMEDFGREVENYWDREHFQRVKQRLAEIAPGLPVESALMGDTVFL